MTDELTILRKEKPENIMEQIDSIEIISLEKEPLTYQLIEELIIGGLIRPENEIQLTDAIRRYSRNNDVYTYEITGKRYDIGSVAGFVEATLDYALSRADTKDAVQEMINEKAKK